MMNMGKDTFTKEELKEALKKFKANRDDVQNQEMVKNEYKYVRCNNFFNNWLLKPNAEEVLQFFQPFCDNLPCEVRRFGDLSH